MVVAFCMVGAVPHGCCLIAQAMLCIMVVAFCMVGAVHHGCCLIAWLLLGSMDTVGKFLASSLQTVPMLPDGSSR
eukprot:365094-Chlamydomonas_euryale.AAC.5